MTTGNAKASFVVGVDLGGTKILAAVFDSELKVLGREKKRTKAHRGLEAVIERISRCVLEALGEAGLTMADVGAVGVGAPGAVDAAGNVLFAPNLDWKNVALKRELELLLGVPVVVANDSDVCTWGVYRSELKSQPQHLLGLFLGTGIGAGLIIDRKLHLGANGTAGEVGHMVLQVDGPPCSCGNRGCFEALAGRKAIFQRLTDGIRQGQKTILTETRGPDLADMRSGDLRKAIRRGDPFVEKVVQEAAQYAGIAVANLMNVLNPDVVVLGGGLIDALEEEMVSGIRQSADKYAFPGAAKGVRIFASKLGDDAGITGAAVLAQENLPTAVAPAEAG